jgi:hypothetical protein
MRASHHKVILWLIRNGFSDIQVITHCRHKDLIFHGKHREGSVSVAWANHKIYSTNAVDIWNVADFICIDRDGKPWLVQVKTSGSLKSVTETAILQLFSRYKRLRNHIGFIACKPVKGSKNRIEYLCY